MMNDPLLHGLSVYIVGGAVRDRLLGLPIKDRDYVVVGTTAEEMQKRGFKSVGKDFPVFLHPKTKAEYALARTERKAGRGYTGFEVYASPEVSLEEDLARRDLTINAIAEDANGQLIDPFNGQADLVAKQLKHVSPAFIEDPVRILRLARFAGRFNFHVAPETMRLMQQMVSEGEVDYLVAERVWQEWAKGLMSDYPSKMVEILRDCGALARLLPELDALFGVPQTAVHHPEIDTGKHTMMCLQMAVRLKASLAERWAVLMHDVGKGLTPRADWPRHIGHEQAGIALVTQIAERLRVPSECRDLAVMACREHLNIHRFDELKHTTRLDLLSQCDAFRKPDRFKSLLKVCEADARGRLGFEEQTYPQTEKWLSVLAAAQSVNSGQIAKACATPDKIPDAIRMARLDAIKQLGI
ncbi:multifunctional CCA addition/repair protein [Leeia sp. TBRC 13508]|uniref:Multifunctional CCA protein n=1 Tax=Leeia speluncae TaxID=2884804 RepID=A0ABS8D3V0_9NEIS|nr:multifunctional CCA addition/repair protein [Leeia speluncae]MCB6182856.1 multifunctional CCA addition/repair protein [Leeia speluncae]